MPIGSLAPSPRPLTRRRPTLRGLHAGRLLTHALSSRSLDERMAVVGVGGLDLLNLATPIVAEAAATARWMRAEAITDVATKSTSTDVVTAADKAVERQIAEALRRVRPEDGILGEEYGDDHPAGSGRVRWIVDPIDGTVNYLYGIAQYAVSLAAEVDGEVVAGIVHNAASDAVWTAVKGHGAWRDGRRLIGSAQTRMDQALVATGFAYAGPRRAHQGKVVAELLPRIRDIRRMGSAALDLCAAAEGQVDAYYEKGLAEWDLAAGALVAREAGLLVSGMNGREAGPDMVLAAPPALHRTLHEALAELDADAGP